MAVLNRKLWRDLWTLKGQAAAIGLIIASGVATFTMSLTTLWALESSQQLYYQRYGFADLFASLTRAPDPVAERVAELPGVSAVDRRIVEQVTLDVADMPEPAIGRLISLPDDRPQRLNRLHLRRGRFPEPRSEDQVVISEAFAEAHGLTPGDSLAAILNQKWRQLRIVGIALSPEYILSIQSGSALPDDEHFGILWMSEETMAAAFDMDGAFNNLAIALDPGASEPAVIARIDNVLAPWGGVGAYGRSDQLSHRYLSDEIRGLRGMGLVAPAIFLAVAAFLLHVVMTRLIAAQREQIATLKAFGYSGLTIGVHYLKFIAVIAAIGTILGLAAGAWLGLNLTELYTRFYRFPVFLYRFEPLAAILACGITGAAATIGALFAVRGAVRLPPAEAMRPEAPPSFRPTLVERLGFQRFLPVTARMILRQLERRPVKAALSAAGIAMATAVLVLGRFMPDTLDHLMDVQFHQVQRQDMQVAFVEPTSAAVAYELERLPGVLTAEPFRSVAVRFRHDQYDRRGSILGLPANPRLYRVLDVDTDRPVELPPAGLVLSQTLADLLRVSPGQRVTVEVLEEERPVRRIRVAATVAEYAGTNAYMHVDALRRLLQEGGTISGAFLTVDPNRRAELYRQLKQTPRVASVTVKKTAIESFEETVAENQRRIQFVNVIFACIIAAGVVYNTARISFSERSRELATLRVIGFTRGEVSAILLGELAILTAVAIPLGWAIGYGFAATVVAAFESELYRFPLVVRGGTLAFAAGVTVLAAAVSGLLVRRRVDRLDLVAVLKMRE